MIYQFILLQFIAHLLADFLFQPHNWTQIKSRNILTWHHVYHGLVVFFFSYILSFDFNFWKAAIILTVIHFIIDVFKSYIELKLQSNGKSINCFFFDQIMHIITLIVVSYLYNNNGINFIFEIPIKITILATAFILSAKPTNVIIKNIFMMFSIETPSDTDDSKTEKRSQDNDKSLPNAGKLIGIMERFLVLSLIIIGQYSAVGLIIAAKSILRFKSTQKNEYVLVGTLLSFGIAVMIGILVSNLYL